MLPKEILHQILIESLNISEADIVKYEEQAKQKNKDLESWLVEDSEVTDETKFYELVAEKLGFPFVLLKGKEIKKEILDLVPAPLAQTHQVVVFEKDKTNINLAMLDPGDIQTIEFIHRKTALNPIVFLTTPSDIKDALHRYHADLENDAAIQKLSEPNKNTEKDLQKEVEELSIINIVNSILEHAFYEGASDIHIEPSKKEVEVLYRVDGMLKNVMTLPKNV